MPPIEASSLISPTATLPISNETSASDLPMPPIVLAFGGGDVNAGSFDEAMEEDDSKANAMMDTKALGKIFKKEIEIYNEMDDTVDQILMKQLMNLRAPTDDLAAQGESIDEEEPGSLALTTPR